MRSCSQPEPEGVGQECIGEYVQTSICYIEPCKGKNEYYIKYNLNVCIRWFIILKLDTYLIYSHIGIITTL